MMKVFLCIFFLLFAFAQHIDYESLSDEQLQTVFQKEFLDMEVRGATPDLIFEKFVVERDKYLVSREVYYRFVVHMAYMGDQLLSRKLENGTDEPSDFEMVKELKDPKSYQEYLDYKRTEAAIEQWENSTHDGTLKLVDDNHNHYNKDEQKRYDGLIVPVNRDSYFSSFSITDGQSDKVILPHTN